MFPAMLPPPAPFKIVVLAAAAFEMNFAHFLLAIFAGRFVRFLLEALLTLWFGPEIVTLAGSLFVHHYVWVLVGVGALAAGWLVWRRARRQTAENSPENKNAAGKDSTLRSEETRLTS
jgi:uncharacterized membrane protein YdjX (TVP38/TMEM64 family)